MGIQKHRIITRSNPLAPEFVFVNDALVKNNPDIVRTNRQIVQNFFFGNTGVVNGAAHIVQTVGFQFARLTGIKTKTIASSHIRIHRLRDQQLRFHIIRQLIDIRKNATKRTVRPERTTTFFHRFENLFLVVSADRLFVLEKFVLPGKTGSGFTFPNGQWRRIHPNHAASGNISPEYARADIGSDIELFIDSRRIIVRGMIVQNAFIISRNARRLRRILVTERAGKVERERKIRP